MGFKFLHIADVHLDTPFQAKTRDVRMFLRAAVRQAFQRAVDLALSEKVHAVLIAGDLFDNHTLSFATEKFIIQQMKRLCEAKVAVFYATGNHDPGGPMYRKSLIDWPGNVNIFNTKQPETYPVYASDGTILAWVTGAGHENPWEKENIVKNFPRAEGTSIPHIGLAHVWVTGAKGEGEHDRYAPCTLEDLKNKNYAYWALGHIHARAHVSEQPLVIYPGNLMGRHYNEEGLKGAYIVEIEDTRRIKSTFYPLAPVCWVTFKVGDLGLARTLADLQENVYRAVARQIEKQGLSGRSHEITHESIARVVLSGPCFLYNQLRSQAIPGAIQEENIQVLEEFLSDAFGFRYVEVVPDGLTRPVVPDDYRGQPHVLGVALDMLGKAKFDPQALMKLKPEVLAGCPGSNVSDTISYLQEMLEGLDYELTAWLLEEERI